MKIVLTPINTKDNLPYNSFSKNARDDYYYEKQFFEDKVKAVPRGNAYCIGNGPSRKGFDLNKYQPKALSIE